VPVPCADARDFLRKPEPALTLLQPLLGLDSFGDVGRVDDNPVHRRIIQKIGRLHLKRAPRPVAVTETERQAGRRPHFGDTLGEDALHKNEIVRVNEREDLLAVQFSRVITENPFD
jgi:hypothetical protein